MSVFVTTEEAQIYCRVHHAVLSRACRVNIQVSNRLNPVSGNFHILLVVIISFYLSYNSFIKVMATLYSLTPGGQSRGNPYQSHTSPKRRPKLAITLNKHTKTLPIHSSYIISDLWLAFVTTRLSCSVGVSFRQGTTRLCVLTNNIFSTQHKPQEQASKAHTTKARRKYGIPSALP